MTQQATPRAFGAGNMYAGWCPPEDDWTTCVVSIDDNEWEETIWLTIKDARELAKNLIASADAAETYRDNQGDSE